MALVILESRASTVAAPIEFALLGKYPRRRGRVASHARRFVRADWDAIVRRRRWLTDRMSGEYPDGRDARLYQVCRDPASWLSPPAVRNARTWPISPRPPRTGRQRRWKAPLRRRPGRRSAFPSSVATPSSSA